MNYGYDDVCHSVFRIYDSKYYNSEEFACGWRFWSFKMTKDGTTKAMVRKNDRKLIARIKDAGSKLLAAQHFEWNTFRSTMMRSFEPEFQVSDRQAMDLKYRNFFSKVAFVVLDCCFVVKYKITTETLKPLLATMFASTNTSEMPERFVILESDILKVEMDHKMALKHDTRYRDAPTRIKQYFTYEPNLKDDGIVIMSVPFVKTHMAMLTAERKINSIRHERNITRNNFNDYGQLFLMTYLRRSFRYSARVALLSDDYHMIKIANGYEPTKEQLNSAYPGLPEDFLTESPHIATPALLSEEYWQEWREQNAH